MRDIQIVRRGQQLKIVLKSIPAHSAAPTPVESLTVWLHFRQLIVQLDRPSIYIAKKSLMIETPAFNPALLGFSRAAPGAGSDLNRVCGRSFGRPRHASSPPTREPKVSFWAFSSPRRGHSQRHAANTPRRLPQGSHSVRMIQSMSRNGNCFDNAPMESCFGTLKTELVHQVRYPTRQATPRALFVYTVGYYNRKQLIPPSVYYPRTGTARSRL